MLELIYNVLLYFEYTASLLNSLGWTNAVLNLFMCTYAVLISLVWANVVDIVAKEHILREVKFNFRISSFVLCSETKTRHSLRSAVST